MISVFAAIRYFISTGIAAFKAKRENTEKTRRMYECKKRIEKKE